MRILFRASDFGQVAKNKAPSCKSKVASVAEMVVLGSFFCFLSCGQAVGFDTQKVETNVDYCHIWSRAECTSLGPGLKHPSLRWLTLEVLL